MFELRREKRRQLPHAFRPQKSTCLAHRGRASGFAMPPAAKRPAKPATPRSSSPAKRPAGVSSITPPQVDPDSAGAPTRSEAGSSRKPTAKAKAKRGKAVASAAAAADAGDGGEAPHERMAVYLKVHRMQGSSPSSCVACDERGGTAWSLDLNGQRSGEPVVLSGVWGPYQPESALSPVVEELAHAFVQAPRGVACLMCYGQAESGREALLHGEAGARSNPNFTPRGMPAPGGHIHQRGDEGSAGLVLAALVEVLGRLGDGGAVEMACVLLHLEQLHDLLSPQSRVRLAESDLDGVQLSGAHWAPLRDAKEAEGMLQMATQNRAVHAGAAPEGDGGFLDACHVIIAVRIPTGAGRGSSLPLHKTLYIVELAPPPPTRPSGIAGLAVEDFCAINASLRGLQACLGVMARKGAARPPVRDSRLTRLLSGALGADPIRTVLLLCVSCQVRDAARPPARPPAAAALPSTTADSPPPPLHRSASTPT